MNGSQAVHLPHNRGEIGLLKVAKPHLKMLGAYPCVLAMNHIIGQ